ncbi:formylglycine-generating enzyme family protein [Treponema denticola]|uniref:formylglycine-generating enzyme family protein n=1 Tax=Treponema denticola TaxID=158 RepID=UPI003D8E017D
MMSSNNNKKVYAFRGAAALVTAAVLAVALLFTACPNNAGGGGSAATVNITVTGDANVNVPSEPVAVRAGAKWAEAKSTVQGKISPKPNFLIDTWHLGEDENAPELKDTDMFVKDTTVFVKSRADLPDLSPIQGSGTQVKITFGVTPAGGGAILGPNPISVNKNTPWNPLLKAYAAAALKVNTGYELVGWKKNGTELDDTFSFDDDANVFAELKDMRIYLTVKGDSHVTVNNPTETIVIKSGVKWQSIKGTVAAKVTVNDPANFAVTAWHKGTSASDPVLTDDYEFTMADAPNCTVYAETGDKRITVTVKYGNGSGSPTTPAGTITVFDGKKWSEVKAEAAAKLNLPYGVVIQKWHWNDAGGQEISANHIFKASDGPRTVYAKVFDKRITVTVKYGKVGTENTPTAGTITVYDGDTWSTVKPKAENKLPSSALAHGATILKWQWNDADGWEINTHTFKVSDGATKTVYALIRPRIVYGQYGPARRLQFYAPESGIVTERLYYLDKIYGATNGTIGQSEQSDNQEHQVSLDAYWMADGEVTQELYELVMGTNPSCFQGPSKPPASGEIQERRPVEQVNWYEAVAFCNELTRCCPALGESECVYTYAGNPYTVRYAKQKKVPSMDRSKKGFRLPTEAEWEWAAQGGIEHYQYPVPWGTSSAEYGDYIWYESNSGSKTHQGLKKKSHPKFPLDDIGGNVSEWCWDWYSSTTPTGGDNPTGATSGTKRVRRGGSYGDHYSRCKCAYRSRREPEVQNDKTGFRIVCRD